MKKNKTEVKRNVLQQNSFYELGQSSVLVFHFLLGHSVPTGEKYEYRGTVFNKLEVNMEQIGRIDDFCTTSKKNKITGKYQKTQGALGLAKNTYKEAINKLTQPIELLWTDKNGNKKIIKQPLLKRKYTQEDAPSKGRYWTDFKIIPLEQFPPFALIDSNVLAYLLKFKNPWIINTYAALLNIKGLGVNQKELDKLNSEGKYYSGNPIITCPSNILVYGLKINKIKQRELAYVHDALLTLHHSGMIFLEDITHQFKDKEEKLRKTKNSRYIVTKIRRVLDEVQEQELEKDKVYRIEEEVEKLGSKVADPDFVDPDLF